MARRLIPVEFKCLVATRIKTRRERLGLTLVRAAAAAGLGGMGAWQAFETGTHLPSLLTLADMAQALRTSADYLIGLRGRP